MTSEEQQKRRLQRSEVESLAGKGLAPSRIAMRVGIPKKAVNKIIRKAKERARP